MSNLRELQESMRAALHQGDASAFLPRVAHSGRSPEARLDVYAYMYFTRQIQSLAEDFPLVQRLVGAPFFERLAVTQVKRHPSSHPSLAFLGREFEETLRSLDLNEEAAVARLEWARVLAFWAPDAEARATHELAALGDKLGDEVLAFHPSLQLVSLAQGVLGIAEGVDASALALDRTQLVAVFRKGASVHEAALQPMEGEALTRALAQSPFGLVCEAFAESASPLDEALHALVEWIGDGWVVQKRPSEQRGDG